MKWRSKVKAVLNQQAQFLQANPSARVVIAGYTDERGSREYNLALGERRAKAAQPTMLRQGYQLHVLGPSAMVKTQPADRSWRIGMGKTAVQKFLTSILSK